MIVPVDGATLFLHDQKWLSFCSHDYLALSDHPEIKKNAIKFLLQYGLCATSYEDSLSLSHQKQLEEKFAALLGKERLFFFPSAPDLSLLLSDIKWIAIESICSLGGHFSDLASFVAAAQQRQALCCIDDSHSFALFGREGMGLAAHLSSIDLITGSLSKGCGVYGYYLACNQIIADHIIQKMAPHYLPSPVIGALDCALELIPQMEGERQQLLQRAHFLRTELQEAGLEIIPSIAPLIALSFQTKEEAEALKRALHDAQILVAPPKQMHSRFLLQLALTSSHMPDYLALLIHEIRAWKEALVVNYQ
ncbi:MAG TPA: aminotransferase class I/II-fold pyridoxal phosphate-dependent enzyme [Rhabdochlamydiaceae bacterium]|nr:aminotransferase class I/II-fold pyridoxal phosphate-dependent enzyme [Rhabdochlamydiaceae bacterium]